jgi:hypothetical protein
MELFVIALLIALVWGAANVLQRVLGRKKGEPPT